MVFAKYAVLLSSVVTRFSVMSEFARSLISAYSNSPMHCNNSLLLLTSGQSSKPIKYALVSEDMFPRWSDTMAEMCLILLPFSVQLYRSLSRTSIPSSSFFFCSAYDDSRNTATPSYTLLNSRCI